MQRPDPGKPTGKKGVGNPAMLAAGAGFEPAGPLGLLPDNPNSTARPNLPPDGNRTHISRIHSRCSLAVELLGGSDGQVRRRYGAFASGNRTHNTELASGGS